MKGRWILFGAALAGVCALVALRAIRTQDAAPVPAASAQRKNVEHAATGPDRSGGHSSGVRRPNEERNRVPESVASSVSDMAVAVRGLARDALADFRRFPELGRCRSEGRDCRKETLAALDVALDFPLRPSIGEGKFGLRELEATLGRTVFSRAVHHHVVRVLTTSDDPIDRVGALALLERANGEMPPLPPEVTERLGHLPGIEQRLVLDELANEPVLSAETEHQVAALAVSEDPALQTRAIRVLGASRRPDALATALSAADERAPISERMALEHVVPALRGCGSACGQVMVSLATAGSPMMQLAALSAVVSLEPEQRARVGREVLDRLDGGRVAPPVKRQLDYLTRLVEA